ncbi:MAG: membrane integrity-associated transporter subunit PqiC [Aeromicrobium sp.]|nr:membrane integrity-associated transporter subunit PqiC [Burkholderiales bacterium]
MKTFYALRSLRFIVCIGSVAIASGCGGVFPSATPQAALYSLDATPSAIAGTENVQDKAKEKRLATVVGTLPTLIVSPVQAAAGYDSPRMLYVRDNHQIEYFAQSEWVDTPARMLTGIVVTALDNSGAFGAVVLTPTAAVGDIRLNIEVVRLHQHFGGGPRQVRLTMRAYLVDYASRKVLASREFDETVAAPSENPQGGVVAANRAAQLVMSRLASFCADASVAWQTDVANKVRKLPPTK